MYIRTIKRKNKDGSEVEYVQLAHNVRHPDKGYPKAELIYSFGRRENLDIEALKRLVNSISRFFSPEDQIKLQANAGSPEPLEFVRSRSAGGTYLLKALWDRLNIGKQLTKALGARNFAAPIQTALFAMVANRVCAGRSKLYCYEQWLAEEVRIAGSERLRLHHLYRAMVFLEANRGAIEERLYYRLADLLNLDVDLVFYDTTSLHFEIDEADTVAQHGSQAAGGKAYPALRKRGKSKNGRDDAPQLVIGLAVTRDGFPVRHWVFPGNTVDVTTVKQVKADLKGWQLNRCLFVGDAGMVSAANLKTLSRGGGRYILCMPIQRGGEVAEAVIKRDVLLEIMDADTEALYQLYGASSIGTLMSGANNNGAHSPNGITAMFIATGQDVANVAESSSGILYTDLTPDGDLYMSLTIPSLIVATYGGGTGLPTQRECLALMGCVGKNKVKKLAEIIAGVALAGEISLGSAISSLDWVSSHEKYGRNR